jgi:hypothetical protein
MNNYKILNRIVGWIVFFIASVVYLLTIEPTASWWDCGEYIATAYKLQVGHPPGAPTFQLLGRFFSLFAFGNVHHVALMVNIMSALSSSFTILFLFWSITMLARKVVVPGAGEVPPVKGYGILAAGIIGSLAYTFSDTFWFSAVEGEVYAMSSLMTALAFWIILKWEENAGEKHAYRWLILLSFVIGISVGVHMLNLLAIPAISFVYYFKKFKPTRWGMVFTFLISILILAFIMYIIIPWLVKLSAKFELLFVNGFGLPFNSGTIFYFLLLIGLIVWGLCYTKKKQKAILNTIILSLTFILIGYSTFWMLIIRANADTPINENAPKDAISLISYLNREQYGDWPIFYGQYWNAPIVDYADGTPVYRRDNASGKYIVIDDRKGTVPVYDERFTTLFPRMWSNQRKGSAEFYKNWGGEGRPVKITGRDGKEETKYRPTFGENLKYFFSYQIGHMYIRYFMWNFAGRQNDVQGFGGPEKGNWLSGIPFIDKMRLGHSQTNLPDNMQSRAHNTLFFLPLILGLIGLAYHVKKDYRDTIVVASLFIMTGLAILVYLNQQPYEPRERDYAYAASFYAFAVWIGLGVIQLIEWIKKKVSENIATGVAFGVTLVFVPLLMAQQNWDDHDRSGKYACRDFASNYLNSCGSQAILFTNGDNDTFPLWYVQEVEGVRTDVRVVNLMLASGAWYIDQLYKKAYDSKPLPFTLPQKDYRQGSNDIIPYYDIGFKGYVELKDLMGWIKSNSPQTFLNLQDGQRIKFFPAKKIKLTVSRENCLKYGIVPRELADSIADTLYWTIRSNQLYKNDVMLLDLIATTNFTRPLCFAAPSSINNVFSMDSMMFVTGFVYKFMPVKAYTNSFINGLGSVDPVASADVLLNKCAWGRLNDPHVYVDPESMNNSIRPKTNILRTATGLMDLHRNKEAEKLMDCYDRYFPESKFPYDMYMIPYAEVYYKLGRKATADSILLRLSEVYCQDLDFYAAVEGSSQSYYDQDIRTSLGVLRNLSQIARENRQTALAAKFDSLYSMRIQGLK